MVFTFILNPSVIDTTFQVKDLMIGHVLDGGLYIWTELLQVELCVCVCVCVCVCEYFQQPRWVKWLFVAGRFLMFLFRI